MTWLAIFGTERPRDQGMRPGRRRAAAAVWTRDDLQQVAVRVIEVESAPIVPGVDLVAIFAAGICPIGKTPLTNPLEDLVELAFAHQKGIVLRRDLPLG